MTKKKSKQESEPCFYCGAIVAERGGGDHFPIPGRNGGTDTVPCCTSCHDMKDRFRLGDWPIEWVTRMIADFPKLSREARLFLAKASSLCSDAMKKTTIVINAPTGPFPWPRSFPRPTVPFTADLPAHFFQQQRSGDLFEHLEAGTPWWESVGMSER